MNFNRLEQLTCLNLTINLTVYYDDTLNKHFNKILTLKKKSKKIKIFSLLLKLDKHAFEADY